MIRSAQCRMAGKNAGPKAFQEYPPTIDPPVDNQEAAARQDVCESGEPMRQVLPPSTAAYNPVPAFHSVHSDSGAREDAGRQITGSDRNGNGRPQVLPELSCSLMGHDSESPSEPEVNEQGNGVQHKAAQQSELPLSSPETDTEHLEDDVEHDGPVRCKRKKRHPLNSKRPKK